MYFSMHAEKQVCSPLEREDEGFGTQRSKQCSFTFCNGRQTMVRTVTVSEKYLYQLSCIYHGSFLSDLVHELGFWVGGGVEGVHFCECISGRVNLRVCVWEGEIASVCLRVCICECVFLVNKVWFDRMEALS